MVCANIKKNTCAQPSKMAQFVEHCGDANPLLSFTNTYTGDKSAWQDQFFRQQDKFGVPPQQQLNRVSSELKLLMLLIFLFLVWKQI